MRSSASHSHTDPRSRPGIGDYKYLPTIVAGPDNMPVIITQAYRYNNYLGEVVLGMRAKAGGGYEAGLTRRPRTSRWQRRRPRTPTLKAIVDPYSSLINCLQQHGHRPDDGPDRHPEGVHRGDQRRQPPGRRLGLRARPRTASPVDFHLSGAMTNKLDRDERPRRQPGHPQGVGHVQPACRTRTRSSCIEHERPAAQGGAGAGLPQLLLLQVRAGLRRLLVLHHLHDRHQQGRQDHVRRPLPGACRAATTWCR